MPGAGRLRAAFRLSREPGGLSEASDPDAESRLARHAQHAGLALAKKAKYFLASTSECYGDPHVSPQPETYWGNVNPIGPRGVYDEAKRFAEAMVMAYHRYHGVDTHIVRIFNTYGPRMRLNDGRALPNFVYQALTGQPITVYGDGKQTRSFCYVSDLIEGIYRLMLSDEHEPTNIGNPQEITILEFAERIRALIGVDSSHHLQALAAGRSQAALPGHLQGEALAGLGAEGESGGRTAADAGVFQEAVCRSQGRLNKRNSVDDVLSWSVC